MAVRSAVDYFNFELERLLVVLDEFQLPFGKLRLRPNGSDGGHNGLGSIIQHLGTEGFARVRLGIGNEFSGDAANFVLSEFSKNEKELLPAVIERAGEAVVDFAVYGVQHAMSRFN
jgi:PTH1 family peptidyl-tRNA hydrolase